MIALRKPLASITLLFLLVIGSIGKSHGQTVSLADDHFEAEYWSGTITWANTVTTKRSGPYSEWVHISRDGISESVMSATFRKGVGSATTRYSKNSTEIRKENIAGTMYTTTTKETGSSNGSAASKLELTYDEEAKTYGIMVTTPATDGESATVITCSGCDGQPRKMAWGEEESGIMVEEQQLGNSPNVLSGEKTTTENRDGTIYETVVRWSFYRGKEDQWLQIVPQQYDNWLPVPGQSEATPGSKLQVGFELKGKNGKAPSLKVDHFELQLVKTSREPGVAINFPITAAIAPAQPDIQFLAQLGATKSADGQTITIPCKDATSGMATIGAFDGGGYTVLQVTAVIRGGMRLSGHLEVETGETDIQIPKRQPGSLIAAKWLAENGNPAEEADDEVSTGNQHNGDGLSAYEEYRGVFSDGKFKRLNPAKKELGVGMTKEDAALFAGGLSLFTRAARIQIVPLLPTELGGDRIWNKNGSTRHLGAQYALHLQNTTLPSGVVGENRPAGEYNKTPKESIITVIDVAQIKSAYTEQKRVTDKAGIRLPYTAEDDLANTVAHELAHGVKVSHHGEPSAVASKILKATDAVVSQVFASDGSERTARPDTIAGKIGVPFNDASGDVACIMAYTSAYQWAMERGPSREFIYKAVPLLAPGKTFCVSPAGTGINANGYFGNATKGNCLSQMVICTSH